MISEERLVKAIFELDAAILASLPEPSECTHVFSASFEKKMKKLIRKANHIVFYKCVRRVACAIAALFIAGSLFVGFNPTARAAVVNWVQKQFSGVYHFFFAGDKTTSEFIEPQTLSPAWLPDGYVESDRHKTAVSDTLVYLNDKNMLLQLTCVYGQSGNGVVLGHGEYSQKTLSVLNFNFEIFLAWDENESNFIVWENNDIGAIFTITGHLSEEDLIKMAMSVTAE